MWCLEKLPYMLRLACLRSRLSRFRTKGRITPLLFSLTVENLGLPELVVVGFDG